MWDDQARRRHFQDIAFQTFKGICASHHRAAQKTWGWLRNKVKGGLSTTTPSKLGVIGGVGLSGIVWSLKQIPVVGLPVSTVTNLVGKAAWGSLINNTLYAAATATDDPDDKMKLTEEYLLAKGIGVLDDSMRKLKDATATWNSKGTPKNCADLNDTLYALYYYSYRLQRAKHYNSALAGYAKLVHDKLAQSEQDWEAARKGLEDKFVESWAPGGGIMWHFNNCSDGCCTLPFDKMAASHTGQILPPMPWKT